MSKVTAASIAVFAMVGFGSSAAAWAGDFSHQGRSERPVSSCGWGGSPFCEKVRRIDGLRVAVNGKSPASAGAVPSDSIFAGPWGRRTESSTSYKLTRINAVAGEPALPTRAKIAIVSTGGEGLHASWGEGSREISPSKDGPSVNEETSPGPYAMLCIGISLVAFMAFRRIAHF